MSWSSKEHLDNLSNNSVLFFDLETIGFVENTLYAQCNVEDSYPDYKSNNYDNARIVQIGWLFQKKFNYEKKITLNNIEELLVKPDGFEIKNSHIHGITHELADKYGIEISNVIKIFAKFIDESDYIIGYNIFFDINIMLNELHRLGMSKTIDKILQLKAEEKILCTGALSQKYIDKYVNYKKYTIPKQIYVYEHLFKKKLTDAHNARNDILATYEITKRIYETVCKK